MYSQVQNLKSGIYPKHQDIDPLTSGLYPELQEIEPEINPQPSAISDPLTQQAKSRSNLHIQEQEHTSSLDRQLEYYRSEKYAINQQPETDVCIKSDQPVPWLYAQCHPSEVSVYPQKQSSKSGNRPQDQHEGHSIPKQQLRSQESSKNHRTQQLKSNSYHKIRETESQTGGSSQNLGPKTHSPFPDAAERLSDQISELKGQFMQYLQMPGLESQIGPQIQETEFRVYPHIQQNLNRTLIPIGNIVFNVEIEKAKALLLFFGPGKVAYIKPVLPKPELSGFYVVERMHACLDELLGGMHIVDLVNASDEHTKAVVTLFKVDILSEDDLKTTKYVKKLQAFDKLIEGSGLTSDQVLGQYAGDKHERSRHIYKPYWS